MAPSRPQASLLSLLAATSLLPLQAWASFDCKDMGTQGTHFDFGKLGGPHVVHYTEEDVEHERPWVVIVWNDPVNLMSYVTLVFQKLFGYSLAEATRLMLQVHHDGKAVVSSGNRERSEHDVARLHAYGLWATMQQD